MKRSEMYGPIYYENVGGFHSLVISDPEIYKTVLRSEAKHPNRREMMPVAYYRQSKGMDLGIVNSQGDEWYKHRSVVSKPMLKLDKVSSFSTQMAEVADDFVNRIDDIKSCENEVQGLERELFKWALESIGTFLFEERLGCLGKNLPPLALKFIENLEGFFKFLQPLMYNLPVYKIVRTKTWKLFEKHTDSLMEAGQQIVHKQVSALKKDGVTSSAFLSSLDTGNMSVKEITGLVIDLLTAAVETTSTASTWSLYLLAKNPEVQEKLLAEISESGAVTGEELSKLPYVRAVVKETLRLYPIVYSTSRHLDKELNISGYEIPEGTHVQANLFGIYRNPEYFPQPEKFRPERWLRENGDKMDSSIKATSNLVWGHGSRMCLGRRIAEQEMYIAISKIVQKFELSYVHEDVEPTLNTMMTPDRPVQITFTPRK